MRRLSLERTESINHMERPKLPERLQSRRRNSPPKPTDLRTLSEAPERSQTAQTTFPPPSSFPPLKTSQKRPSDPADNPTPLPPTEAVSNPSPTKHHEPIKASSVPAQTESPVQYSQEDEDDSEAINFMKLRKSNRKTIAKKEAKRWKKRLIVAGLTVAAPAAFILTLFQFHTIPSHSMSPTVENNDLLISFRFANLTPETGDIVVFNGAGTDWGDQNYLKRVIGTNGDTITCCEDGSILLNGELLPEPYLLDLDRPASGAGFDVAVQEESFFALGDNRYSSKDSRYFFTQSVPNGSIIAEPFLGINLSEFHIYQL